MKLDLRSLIQRIKPYTFYIVVSLIFVGEFFAALYFFPTQVQKLVNTWADVTFNTQEIAKLAEVEKVLEVQDNKSLAPYLSKVKAALPDEKKAAGLITGLGEFGSKYGIAVTALDFSPGLISTSSAQTGYNLTDFSGEVIQSNIRGVPITFNAVTDINSLKIFLDNINKTSQIIGITLINYSSMDKGTNTANISAIVFYQPNINTYGSSIKVKPLTQEDIKFIGELPEKDVFRLQVE